MKLTELYADVCAHEPVEEELFLSRLSDGVRALVNRFPTGLLLAGGVTLPLPALTMAGDMPFDDAYALALVYCALGDEDRFDDAAEAAYRCLWRRRAQRLARVSGRW